MDPITARKVGRTLEPYHGIVYFLPEAAEAYEACGITGRDGYFASRSAPMGAVSAPVVIATFYNFNPALIEHAIPTAWERTTPAAMVSARLDAVDRGLRRLLGAEVVESSDMARAADLARVATEGCRAPGRPLYAGHASLPWPDDPHLVLWHAITLIREFRGDGHIACLVTEQLDPVEALVTHAATGLPRAVLQSSRAWPDEDWDAGVARLAARGLVDGGGGFTDAGTRLRERIEANTDELALPAWEALGQEGCDELRALVRPWSRVISDSGAFGRLPD